MKKTTISITVNTEAYLSAKEILPNLSGFLSSCLENVTKQKPTETDNIKAKMEEYDKTIIDAHIGKSLLAEQLRNKEENDMKKAQEIQDNEQYKRWKCGVCKHLNYFEPTSKLCMGHCGLPTRDSPSTTIVDIREVTK